MHKQVSCSFRGSSVQKKMEKEANGHGEPGI